MELNVLSVRERTKLGKGVARKLRRAGRAPAVAYAGGKQPIHFELDPSVLMKTLRKHGKNTVLQLQFEGGTHPPQTVMVHDLQRDPITRAVLHADFILIDLDKPVKVRVRLNYEGRPIGIQMGGIADVVRRDLEIECLPHQIPQEIKVDVTNLGLNEVLHISDIELPPGVKAAEDPRYTLLTISSPVEDEEKSEEEEEETE